ncbi:hypothetical protein [Sinomonas sp.]|jgi:hypothetical protein|uniref:hypothetical protein n=1 Tax=Sinomonas sp. TaxID=1914986 RepID=UPI003F7CF144
MTDMNNQRPGVGMPILAAVGALALVIGGVLGALGVYLRSAKALDEALQRATFE